ncbi:MAG: hypothetical protein PVI21_03790 [Candidatus Woesebacteria bacterium]|jgi:hypothetical protein
MLSATPWYVDLALLAFSSFAVIELSDRLHREMEKRSPVVIVMLNLFAVASAYVCTIYALISCTSKNPPVLLASAIGVVMLVGIVLRINSKKKQEKAARRRRR